MLDSQVFRRIYEIYRREGAIELTRRSLKFSRKFIETAILIVFTGSDVISGRWVRGSFLPRRPSCYRINPSVDGLGTFLFWFNCYSPHLRRRIDGQYEIQVMEKLVSVVGPETVFWEVGAAWGYHSLLVAEMADSVVGFEPITLRADLMKRSVAENGYENITVHNDKVENLDQFWEGPKPDVVLVDIDGGEFSLLPASEDLLSHGPIWIVELHDNNGTIENLFRDHGYDVERFNERGSLDWLGREDDSIHNYHIIATPKND